MTSSHATCTHPKTKAARARCRKNQAKIAALWAEHEAENQAYHEAYIVPLEKQEKARKSWETLCDRAPQTLQASAEDNADLTAKEEGFECYSTRWYKIAESSLQLLLDTADKVANARDPEAGQVFSVDDDWFWIDRVYHWDEGGNRLDYPRLDIIDARGDRSRVSASILVEEEED